MWCADIGMGFTQCLSRKLVSTLRDPQRASLKDYPLHTGALPVSCQQVRAGIWKPGLGGQWEALSSHSTRGSPFFLPPVHLVCLMPWRQKLWAPPCLQGGGQMPRGAGRPAGGLTASCPQSIVISSFWTLVGRETCTSHSEPCGLWCLRTSLSSPAVCSWIPNLSTFLLKSTEFFGPLFYLWPGLVWSGDTLLSCAPDLVCS